MFDIWQINVNNLAKTNPDDASYFAGMQNQANLSDITWREFYDQWHTGWLDWVNGDFMKMGWLDGRGINGKA